MSGPADPDPPPEVETLASERAEARAARDFARADGLKAQIELAGWRVIDDGPRYALTPARPPDRRESDRVVYGSAATVPSRLEQPAQGPATAIVLVADRAEEALATTRGLAASTAPDVDIVMVASDGSVDRTAVVDGMADATPSERLAEFIWTVERMSLGESLEAGVRRASGAIVVVVEAGAIVESDPVGAIDAALRDETVAVVGSEGLVSADLHRFERAESVGAVAALGPTLVGFRRDDAARLTGIDVRLTGYAGVVAWISLALREARDGGATRQAVALDLPVRPRPWSAEDSDARRGPIARRDRYRIAARFGGVPELAGRPERAP